MDGVLKEKIENLPQKPGSYLFKNSLEEIIYVGKAKNIKKRVKSHFLRPQQHSIDFTGYVADIDFILALNENEALLLEAQLIKKYNPKYNVAWKDDKDYFFVGFTREKFPRVVLTHNPERGRDLGFKIKDLRSKGKDCILGYDCVGPFISGGQLRWFLRELRKLFPYRTCTNMPKKACMYKSLGLCPGPCEHSNLSQKYENSLRALRALLWLYQGGGGNSFEYQLISGKPGLDPFPKSGMRIEGYDISNLSGTLAVGSMVVFEGGQPNKDQYRKFKIKRIQGQNDVGSLIEVIQRRMMHLEWRMPDLILIDGGKGQLNAVKKIAIPAIGLAKFKRSGGKIFSIYSKNAVQLEKFPENVRNILLQVRDEAHRFAIGYNKKRREEMLDARC